MRLRILALLTLAACRGPANSSTGSSAKPGLSPLDLAILGPAVRQRPDPPANGPGAAVLASPRNSFESFQVAVDASDGALTGCTVALAGPLKSADGSAGRWPDALVPAHLQTVTENEATERVDVMVIGVEFLDGPAKGPWCSGAQRPRYDAFLAQPGRPREASLYSACATP